MAKYVYNMAIERPSDVPITTVTYDLVGVWCGDISYGTTFYDGTGLIELDLPDAVIKRLNHGYLEIVLSFRKMGKPGMAAQDIQELIRVDVKPCPVISGIE